MARRKAVRSEADVAGPESQKIARLVPTQKRSRERFESILACAVEVMAEKGSEAFRMSDIVERTGIAFGSLYQYFPDKTAIIGTLAERYNAIGHDCVRKELLGLRKPADLHTVLGRITCREDKRSRARSTQADRALQKLDEEDGAFLTGLLVEALRPLTPHLSEAALVDFCQLMMVLMSAAVRHAITMPPKKGRRILTLFKKMLPHDPNW